jgi:7-cyano-7-deazaguanine reductase
MPELSLGSASTSYTNQYAPALLYPISRQLQRKKIGIKENGDLPFSGREVWNGYEFSWLSSSGKPFIGIIQFEVPATSPMLLESKSVKLYLGSFSGTFFDSEADVLARLEADLSAAAQAPVPVVIIPFEGSLIGGVDPAIQCLDELDIEMPSFSYEPGQLANLPSSKVEQTLYTDLFRSLCPITGQPDYARILIGYAGHEIDKKRLLQYLLSYREHEEFAEQVSERIFLDIMHRCAPAKLVVAAEFTRRGGVDINSHRWIGFEDWVYRRNYRQ